MPGGTWTDQAQVEPRLLVGHAVAGRVLGRSRRAARPGPRRPGTTRARAARASSVTPDSSRPSSQCRELVLPVQRGREHWRVVGVDRHRHGRPRPGPEADVALATGRSGCRRWTSGTPRAECGARPGSRAVPDRAPRRCRARSARRRDGAAHPRSTADRSTRRRAARCAARLRGPARSTGANCSRPTPTSGPPRPKLTSPSGRCRSAASKVTSADCRPASPWDVEAPPQDHRHGRPRPERERPRWPRRRPRRRCRGGWRSTG